MGQSTVILAVAATVLIGIVMLGMQRSNNESDADLAVYHNDVLAREAAMTGINMSVRRLVDEPDQWFTNTDQYGFGQTSYNGATFEVGATSSHPDTVRLVSLGTHHNRTKRIEAVYAKGLIMGALNEAFHYAIITDEDLTLNGSVEIRTPNGITNASVHANGDLTSNGNNVHVEGYATYGPDGSATVNPEKAIDDIFDPNTDTNGADANVYVDEEIDIPTLDPAKYTLSPPSDMRVWGDTTLFSIDRAWLTSNGYGADVGTVDHPFTLYVGGNLTVSSPVVIEDIYFKVVVNGATTLNDDVLANSMAIPAANDPQADWDAWEVANLDADGKTMIGIFSNGDITLDGGVSITGQLFSNNTITLNGGGGQRTNILGGIVSANVDIKANGNVAVTYTELATVGGDSDFTSDTPEGVRLVDWAEF